jgi:hypothetical protein
MYLRGPWNVQEDMGKHLVPLTLSDECHLLENKQKSDSVTRTWVIVMKPDVGPTGGHEQTLSASNA